MDYYINLFNTNDKKKIKDDIILVMLGQERNNLIKLAKTNKVVSKYMNELDEVNKNPEFREYMSYELEQEILRNSERKLGFKEGIEKGIEQGIEQSKKEIVNNLLNTNMSISDISKIVNLPDEEIIKKRGS